jgi:hypothetical protein
MGRGMSPRGLYVRKSRTAAPGLRRRLPVDDHASHGRPTVLASIMDGPQEPTPKYTPEQVLAMHVLWQAVADVTSVSVRPFERESAAQFLLGYGAYAGIHAFWCALVGVPARAAVEQVMVKHGTAIARARAHGVREMLRRQAERRR